MKRPSSSSSLARAVVLLAIIVCCSLLPCSAARAKGATFKFPRGMRGGRIRPNSPIPNPRRTWSRSGSSHYYAAPPPAGTTLVVPKQQNCPGCVNAYTPPLDWSIIKGWTVPLSAAKGKCWQAAHLVHPKSDIEERSDTDEDEDEALGSSSTIKTPSSDINIACKLSNQRSTILTSVEKAEPTHKSSDPSRRGTCSSSRRQISPSEPATVEPNGSGSRRYPFRARKNAAEPQR